MLWILADYSDTAFSFNDFAFFANWLYRCSNFHSNRSFQKKFAYNYIITFPIIQAYYENFSYLSLQIILPFVKSYGDNSMVTLSPGKILI